MVRPAGGKLPRPAVLCVGNCRGADSRARRNAADTNRLPIKRQAPIASAAALTAQPLAALPPYGCSVSFTGSERPVQGYSTARERWCIAAPPDVSLRGAKRRGNLAVPDWTTGKLSAKSQLPSRDCHVGLRPPRNDKPVCLTPLNYYCNTCDCLWRSLSAATDAIGLYVLSLPCTNWQCLTEMTNPVVCADFPLTNGKAAATIAFVQV